jgi:hypothetical protein
MMLYSVGIPKRMPTLARAKDQGQVVRINSPKLLYNLVLGDGLVGIGVLLDVNGVFYVFKWQSNGQPLKIVTNSKTTCPLRLLILVEACHAQHTEEEF